MSSAMSMVLEGTRDYLIDQNSWNINQCDIQFRGVPPAVAGDFFISLDDGGTEAPDEISELLKEIQIIEVAVWRRLGGVPRNKQGVLFLNTDLYRATVETLSSLERKVMAKVHGQWALRLAINAQFSLPDATLGGEFTSRFAFTGRSRPEAVVIPDAEDDVYLGRRLRFRGMMRRQYVESIG